MTKPNAFTIPERAFSDAELRAMKKSAGSQRGGQIRHRDSGGQIFPTIEPILRPDADESQRVAADQAINDLKASGELRRREDARALRYQIERGAE